MYSFLKGNSVVKRGFSVFIQFYENKNILLLFYWKVGSTFTTSYNNNNNSLKQSSYETIH